MRSDDIVSIATNEGRLSVLESQGFDGRRLWTVAFVNYKTSVFLKWQLRILFEFNDPKDFCVIIVDNSRPHEREELSSFLKQYDGYGNIKIVFYEPKEKSASGQHGESLTLAMKMAESVFFLANDPDFFWVRKNYLNWVATLLESGYVAVGAPYTAGVGIGNPMFPALWGAAHRLADIKDLDCFAESSKEKLAESFKKYPGREYSFDVGWKIREKLSKNEILNFISFKSKVPKDLLVFFGKYSFECLLREYFYDDQTVAFHLFRGSFTDKVDGVIDVNAELSNRILERRDLIGRCFYDIIATGKRPALSFWRRLIFALRNHKEFCDELDSSLYSSFFSAYFHIDKKQYKDFMIYRVYIFGIRCLKIIKRI